MKLISGTQEALLYLINNSNPYKPMVMKIANCCYAKITYKAPKAIRANGNRN